jgi:dienelactone hydrolase
MVKSRRWLWVGVAVVAVLVVIAAGSLLFLNARTARPMPEALAALESDTQVEVQRDGWLVFRPLGREPQTGFIFYPGGLVDPAAYAPPARALAEQGYLVVVPPMPLNLAVLAPNEASSIIAAYPAVQNWAIGGHSLGGAMAAQYADQNPDAVDGLALWAAFPAGSNDLSEQDLQVASIYGTLDGLATPEEVRAAQPQLPAGTTWAPIEGGNHAQFGWYGPQQGDNEATISRVEQQTQAIAATAAMLAQVTPGP